MTSVSLQHMAQRASNAHASLVEVLSESAKINEADARKAAAYYIRHRIVKMDWQGGRYIVKHGAFYDADVIKRAVLS